MKRKRLDRDIWTFDRYPYYQLRVDIEEFHGLVCLIQLLGGVAHVEDGKDQFWERPKAGKVAICGRGMTWLQLIPDGKRHVLTAKYLPNLSVSIWYADIIENMEYDPDGVAVFIDKYLDVRLHRRAMSALMTAMSWMTRCNRAISQKNSLIPH